MLWKTIKQFLKKKPQQKNVPSLEVNLEEIIPSFQTVFPQTRYFEDRFQNCWKPFLCGGTVPAGYDQQKSESFPIFYQIDANLYFPSTAPFHLANHGDIMSTLRPFILVSIGYFQEESHRLDWLRVRDLVPSGRRLHVTLGARELSSPGPYQWLTARGTSELLAQTSL